MASVDDVLQRLRSLLDEHPEVASAALLALAVERDVIDERTARAWARSLDLEDFQQTRALLVREVDRRGQRATLVELARSGRRIQRRTVRLLKVSRP